MGKSIRNDRWFDEFDFEPHADNIEQRRKEEKERRRNRRKEFDLEATDPYIAPYNEPINRNRKH